MEGKVGDKFNIEGQKFGKWLVIKDLGVIKKQRTFLCRCECGKEYCVAGYKLRKGKSSSCVGCASRKYPVGEAPSGLKKSRFEELMAIWNNTHPEEGTVKLPIFKGIVGKEEICGYTLIDENMWGYCSKVMWITNKAGYVYMTFSRRNRGRLGMEAKHGAGGKDEKQWLHRVVLDLPQIKQKGGTVADHINGNCRDNRRANLRVANCSQNTANSKVSNNTGFKGVYFKNNSEKNPYKVTIADITGNKKTRHLGCYSTLEEAAKVYDKAAKEQYGEYAKLNFPDGD